MLQRAALTGGMVESMKTFPERKVKIKEADGTERVFTIRPYKYGDETGIVDCVREEYGETYFKQDFYEPEKVKEFADSGHIHFFVAEQEGFIAGMVILTVFSDREDYIEPASHILRKKYRGTVLGASLGHYVLDMGKSLCPCSLFVHAVTFHRSTQILCEKYGMVPVGFRLGTFLAEHMSNSYKLGRCEKYSEGVMILPVTKRDAGVIYLPEEVAEFGRRIYEQLKVPVEIKTTQEVVKAMEAMEEEPQLQIHRDSLQRTVLVRVESSGRTIADRMQELIDSFKGEKGWTIQITLSTSSPAVFYEYDQLRRLGFFFTGLKPLCGNEEQMCMQWLGDVPLYMEEYALTDSFQVLREQIGEYYKNRNSF